jgi:hypothetical protein
MRKPRYKKKAVFKRGLGLVRADFVPVGDGRGSWQFSGVSWQKRGGKTSWQLAVVSWQLAGGRKKVGSRQLAVGSGKTTGAGEM